MKVKLSEIVNGIESIRAIQEVKLPVKISYRIKRLVDKLAPILKAYDEKRNELISELGSEETNEKGEKVKSIKDPEKVKVFMEKIIELTNVEEDIDFTPIKISELGEVSIAPKDFINWMFEE